MDPISLIVAAVVAGAATAIKDQAAQVVKDAYGALKRLLTDRHHVDVSALERKPESGAKQASLTEDLGDTGAAADPEVMAAARRAGGGGAQARCCRGKGRRRRHR